MTGKCFIENIDQISKRKEVKAMVGPVVAIGLIVVAAVAVAAVVKSKQK
ncbi:MAG: hypothetical protein H6Q60_213 [Oscillospiraceae bacterium]|nr:hypothetical protein [Oscillospiraceae bacterium]